MQNLIILGKLITLDNSIIFLNNIKFIEVETIINRYKIVSEPLSMPRGIDNKKNTLSEKIIEKIRAKEKKVINNFSKALTLFVLATKKAIV